MPVQYMDKGQQIVCMHVIGDVLHKSEEIEQVSHYHIQALSRKVRGVVLA